ncbi:sulfurtransferase [bacterium]|nr:sulfurtransferase [bacterium]
MRNMLRRNAPIIIGLLLVAVSFAYAGKGIISAKDAADLMDKEGVVFVSARTPDDYSKVHIKGAVNVNHKDFYKAGDMIGILIDPLEIAKMLGAKGISETNTIIVYDGGDNIAAGRIYYILSYLGAENVWYMDGGMKMWQAARKPVTGDLPEINAVTFNAKPNAAIFVDTDYMKAHYKDAGAVLVDVRSKEEYDGEKGEITRKGHIPGAINLEYKLCFDEKKGTLKPKEELEKIFKGAGVSSDKEVILYCETSIRAGGVFMVLKDILGYSNVKVYDGAMYEWTADSANPVE